MRKLHQQGLSLVELMVAMVIGGVISVGVINLFSANSETYNLMQGQSRLQESARFAMDFLSRSTAQAGYKGCLSSNEDVMFTMYLESDIPAEWDIRDGISGHESLLAGTWSPDLTVYDTPYIPGNAIDTSAVLVGTDVFTVRYLSSTFDFPLIENMDESDARIPILDTPLIEQAFGDPDDDDPDGPLGLIHDCEKSTLFKLTRATDPIRHKQEDNVPGQPRNSTASLMASYGTDASVGVIVTDTFFIAPGAGINDDGDTPFSLWRKMTSGAPVELVEGVEDLQVLYGVDTDDDDVPNQYFKANLVPNLDFSLVVTARISITVNSVDSVGGTSTPTHECIASGGRQPCFAGETIDGLLRRTFHQTVQLRNQ